MLPCARCEYDLSACAGPGQQVTCPECGLVQSVAHAVGNRLPQWKVAVRLTWPTLALCGICALLVFLAGWSRVQIFGQVSILACAAAIMSGWVAPIAVGWNLASQAEPAGRRQRRLRARYIAIGLALNLAIGVACLFVGALIALRYGP